MTKMKHKSTHISRIIICIVVALGAFIAGTIYGEKSEKKRISAEFMRAFQESFGTQSWAVATWATHSKP